MVPQYRNFTLDRQLDHETLGITRAPLLRRCFGASPPVADCRGQTVLSGVGANQHGPVVPTRNSPAIYPSSVRVTDGTAAR